MCVLRLKMSLPAYIHFILIPPGAVVCIPLNTRVCVCGSILLSVQLCSLTRIPHPSPSFSSSSPSFFCLLDDPVASLAWPLIQSSSRLISKVVNIHWAVPGVGTAASCKLIITLLFSVSASNLFPCCRHCAQCRPAVPACCASKACLNLPLPLIPPLLKGCGKMRWGGKD